MFPKPVDDSWINALSDEDLAFLKRFVLASGSLKDLAAAYGVTYPTIRLRLDRLIEKVRLLDRKKNVGRFEKLLLTQYADGKLDEATMRTLLAAHEQEVAEGGRRAGEAGAVEHA